MYRNAVQNRLSIVQTWEEFSDHYLIDNYARFAEFPTNQRVAQMFADKVEMYDDLDQRDQFIKDFISDLEQEDIRVYRYDHRNVSFQLVEDPFPFFKKRFGTWRGNV